MDCRAGRPFCGGPRPFFARMTARLLRWATAEFEVRRQVNSHGISQQAVLRQVQKAPAATSRTDASLPGCMRHVWDWFLSGIPYYHHSNNNLINDFYFWQQSIEILTEISPRSWEVRALCKLTELWRKAQNPVYEPSENPQGRS